MLYVLVLIGWNGTLAALDAVPFTSAATCQSAGEAWWTQAKGIMSDARYVCMPIPTPVNR